jgi:hypothetical protein
LQVFVTHSGGQPEVVDLGGPGRGTGGTGGAGGAGGAGAAGGAHGLQDITSLSLDLMNGPTVGLCETCTWVRIVTNRRGSAFYRCLRADTDPRFVRYPPLPVLQCAGYERRDALAQPQRDRDEG